MSINQVSNNVSYNNVNKSEILVNQNSVDILSNSGGDNESRKLVGVSNGVVISVDELEKEWEKRLGEYVGRRASFPQVYGETKVSQMFYEDRVSSSGCVEDEVSSYGPLSCCSDVFVSGKARKYFNDFMLPFAHLTSLHTLSPPHQPVSYTHLDVYKRQLITIPLITPLNYLIPRKEHNKLTIRLGTSKTITKIKGTI